MRKPPRTFIELMGYMPKYWHETTPAEQPATSKTNRKSGRKETVRWMMPSSKTND